MKSAVLPVVSMDTGSTVFNTLHGLVSEQDAGKMRTCLTPISSDRSLTIQISYGESITGGWVEARDLSGERLIETQDLVLTQDGDEMSAQISFKNLIDADTEYLMVLVLTTEENPEIRYYTRFYYTEDNSALEEAEEALAFVKEFHEMTFDKNSASDLLTWLEPSSDAANDTFSEVTLYSSSDMVTWGDMDPEVVTDPVYTIIDFQGETFGISSSYYIRTLPGDDEEDASEYLYRVEEYYEIQQGTERFYLMDYRRTVSQDFDPENLEGEDGALNIGIADADLQVMQDEDEDTTAFVQDGRLFAVQESGKLMIYVFGFDSAGETGERETFAEHDIKIMYVDQDGSIDFLVYGYMNSGSHEGEIGCIFYHYNGEHRTLEEKAFIAYDGSWEMLRYSIDQVCYYNQEEEKLYLVLNDGLYEIDVDACSIRVMEDELSGRETVVSESGQLIAYEEMQDGVYTGRIVLLNLNGLREQIIEADSGGKVVPLGFLHEDLIYGTVQEADVVQDTAGITLEPMSHIMIVDEELNVLEDYYKSGIYVTSVDVKNNQVTLYRVQKTSSNDEDTTYETMSEDEIVSSASTQTQVYTSITSTDRYENTVQILIGDATIESLRYVRPQEIYYEGSRELTIQVQDNADSQENQHYYIYDCAGLIGYKYDLAEAIAEADASNTGVVVNDKSQYLWKASYSERSEIDALTVMEEGATTRNSVEVCLEAILTNESIVADDVAGLLAEGMTVSEILEEKMPDAQVYDLTGCSLDNVLYYVSEHLPVYAVTGSGQAVLIIGYGPENAELYDPGAGSVYLITRETAEEIFAEAGNRFIVYVPISE